MSIKVMSRVWEASQHRGTDLLMLLALADFSDDAGNSYPAVGTLAAKCRMQSRNAGYILKALQASGELEVRANEGPKGTNRYRIVLESRLRVPVASDAEVQHRARAQRLAGVQSRADSPAIQRNPHLQHVADEPSLNHQEPSVPATSSPRGLPECPHRELIDLFVTKVTDLPKPRVELWTGSASSKDLAARWKWVLSARRASGDRYATDRDQALAWFGRFFDTVAGSDFLTGRDGKWSACNLQWLVKPRNFAKVVEGNYNREASAT